MKKNFIFFVLFLLLTICGISQEKTGKQSTSNDIESKKNQKTIKLEWSPSKAKIYDDSPLFSAINTNDKETVEMLLGNGADPNSVKNNMTPLSLACEKKKFSIAELLINNGANINLHSEMKANNSPLWKAIESGDKKIVNLLLSHNVDLKITDSDDNTVIHKAVQEDNLDLLKKCISAGVNINALNTWGESALFFTTSFESTYLLLKNGADPNLQKNGSYPIIYCTKAHPSKLRLLLKYGADISAKNKRGEDVFEKAKYSFYPDHLIILKEYVATHGLNVHNFDSNVHPFGTINTRENSSAFDYSGLSKNEQLLEASRNGDLKHIKELKTSGLNLDVINERDTAEFNALIYACCNGNYEVADYLIKNGADINYISPNVASNIIFFRGKNALGLALTIPEANSEKICMLLVDNGIDVNQIYPDGSNALHLSIFKNYKTLSMKLIEKSTDIDFVNKDGLSALIFATLNNRKEIVKQLVEAGADQSLKTNTGYSALEIAEILDLGEIKKILTN